MTPEQLRIFTDTLASAGAAIGGPGSAGDLIGQTVIARNRRNESAELARLNEILSEQRAAKAGTQYQEMVRRIGEGLPIGGTNTIEGNTSELSGTAKDYLSSMSQFEGMLTPKTQEGITGVKRNPDGTMSVEYTPYGAANMLSPEQSASAITQGRQQREAPTSKELQAREAKATSEAAMNQLVDLGGGQYGTMKQVADLTLRNLTTPDRIKVLNLLSQSKELTAFDRYLRDALTSEELGARESKAISEATKASNEAALSAITNQEGIGPITVGELSKHNLAQTDIPTTIRTLQLLGQNPELLNIDIRRKTAGATQINLGAKRDIAEMQADVKAKSAFGTQEYKAKLEKEFDKTPEGEAISDKIRFRSPDKATAIKDRNLALNRKILSEATRLYGDKKTIRVDRDTGVKWVGYTKSTTDPDTGETVDVFIPLTELYQ